jgi:phosphoglycolate phosphatase
VAAKYRAVMFDLDGTLLNTLEDIANSVNRGLAGLGYPTHEVETYKSLIGNGRDVLASLALPAISRATVTIQKLVDLINEDYILHWADNTSPYPGISEMLDSMVAKDLKLAILSNKPDEFTQQIVGRMLSNWKFEIVSGASHDMPVKPDPKAALQIATKLGVLPGEILYVGDSDVDMKMATAAKMFAVGVLWGFRTGEELEDNGARVLVSAPSEILGLL